MADGKMPIRGNTFKIFIGNLAERATGADLKSLFEQHGSVVESDVVKNYGFVHMENEEEGKAAIDALNGYFLHGKAMVVEASTGSKRNAYQKTKIFVGNIHKDTKVEELRSLFEVYGSVTEADILSNFAFVHMDDEGQAQKAIRELDGYELHGLRLRVQESTSRVRQKAGMGSRDLCYRCGSTGHWSKECPRDMRMGGRFPEGIERGRGFGPRFDPYPPPPPMYGRDRMMRYREDFSPYDDRERFYEPGPYPRHYETFPPVPPMFDDPYERRLPPRASEYLRYGRRSPLRYPPPPPPSMLS